MCLVGVRVTGLMETPPPWHSTIDYSSEEFLTQSLSSYLLVKSNSYRPRSRGDNAFGSVRVFVCLFVGVYVTALLSEPFDP